jgi:hypothetical protein
MALLAAQQVANIGTTPSFVAGASGGDTVRADGSRLFLWFKNTSGGAIVATVAVPGTYFGQALADIAVSVPATTGERLVALDGKEADNTGIISITYSANPPTGLTVGLFRL